MRLANSSHLPDELIREMIRFACPSGVTNFDVTVKTARQNCGRAWCRQRKQRILVKLDPKTRYPEYWKRGRMKKGYLDVTCYTPHETALMLIAHELRHLWQRNVPRGWRVWNARGQYSERDADAYAIRLTRAWRRRGMPCNGVRITNREASSKCNAIRITK